MTDVENLPPEPPVSSGTFRELRDLMNRTIEAADSIERARSTWYDTALKLADVINKLRVFPRIILTLMGWGMYHAFQAKIDGNISEGSWNSMVWALSVVFGLYTATGGGAKGIAEVLRAIKAR